MANKKLSLLILAVLLVTMTSTTFASSSAKNLGLGDNFVTITGADALYGNPAAVNANRDVFTLELGAAAGIWNNLLRNGYLDQEEKDDLLKQETGLLVRSAGQAGSKLIIGPVATNLEVKADGNFKLAPDVAELLLNGNEIDKTYDLAGTTGSGGVYGDAAVNLSVPGPEQIWDVQNLYVGFTYHQLAGTIFQANGQGDLTVGYDQEGGPAVTGNDGKFSVKYNKPEGVSDLAVGSAIDVGAYARLNETYSVGVSASNIGSLTADASTTYVRDYEVEYDETGNVEGLKEVGEEPLNEKLDWRLPVTYRLGGKMNYSESITLLTDYSYTTYYNNQENYIDHKLAGATELDLLAALPLEISLKDILLLRSGFNYSTLEQDYDWSAGLGLDIGPVEADFGVSDLSGLYNQTKDFKTGLTTKIEF